MSEVYRRRPKQPPRRPEWCIVWRVGDAEREVMRGEHHDILRRYLGMRREIEGLFFELAP